MSQEEFRFSLLRKAVNAGLSDENKRLVRDLIHDFAEQGNYEAVKFFVKNCTSDMMPEYLLACSAGSGNLELVKYLVSVKFPSQEEKDTALHSAAIGGKLEVVQYFISIGADANNEYYRSLLYSAYNGHLDVLTCLINEGGNFRARNNGPLRYAAGQGHFNIVKYLVNVCNADIFVKNGEVLLRATFGGKHRAVKDLDDVRCKRIFASLSNPPLFPDREDSLEKFKLLFGKNFLSQEEKELILQIATDVGYPEIVKFLLEKYSEE